MPENWAKLKRSNTLYMKYLFSMFVTQYCENPDLLKQRIGTNYKYIYFKYTIQSGSRNYQVPSNKFEKKSCVSCFRKKFVLKNN